MIKDCIEVYEEIYFKTDLTSVSFNSRLTRLMDQRTTRIMEKEIIDFNIDTISNQPELFSCE